MNFIVRSLIKLGTPADKLWDPQTQCWLEYFSIGHDFTPQEMIAAETECRWPTLPGSCGGYRFDWAQ